ncbi:MAG TPA: hypothetical protein VHA33_06610 [Candidatus Angelobacter sp.]|nr:hypothetical protein [Candidatus Angelobacter sp.]
MQIEDKKRPQRVWRNLGNLIANAHGGLFLRQTQADEVQVEAVLKKAIAEWPRSETIRYSAGQLSLKLRGKSSMVR